MKRTILFFLTLTFTLTCLSCGGGGGGGGGSSSTQGKLSFVQITLGGSEKPDANSNSETTGFRENSIPSNIYKFTFTISASDMATVQKDVIVSGQTAVTAVQYMSSSKFLQPQSLRKIRNHKGCGCHLRILKWSKVRG